MKGGLGDCLTTISLRYCRLIADLSTNYFVILPTSSTDLVNYKCEIRTDTSSTKKPAQTDAKSLLPKPLLYKIEPFRNHFLKILIILYF